MNYDRPLPTRPITAEVALEILRELQRQAAEEAEPKEITAATTVADWIMIMDLVDGAEFLDHVFGLKRSKQAWRSLLQPAHERTLGEVCQHLAQVARIEALEPLPMLGKPCLSAGVFLTIRSILARDGADVSNLRPSSLLKPFLRHHYSTFMCHIAKLAPGRLPVLQIHRPFQDSLVKLGFFGLLLCIAGYCWGSYFGVSGLIILLLTQLGIMCTAAWPPANVELGDLRDFRDLVRMLLMPPPSG